jgi:hypothetical protein
MFQVSYLSTYFPYVLSLQCVTQVQSHCSDSITRLNFSPLQTLQLGARHGVDAYNPSYPAGGGRRFVVWSVPRQSYQDSLKKSKPSVGAHLYSHLLRRLRTRRWEACWAKAGTLSKEKLKHKVLGLPSGRVLAKQAQGHKFKGLFLKKGHYHWYQRHRWHRHKRRSPALKNYMVSWETHSLVTEWVKEGSRPDLY